MHCIHRINLVTGSLYLLSSSSVLPTTPHAPGSHSPVLASMNLVSVFNFFFRFYISEIMSCLSFSDLLHWAQCPESPLASSQMARCHSFLWPNNIPLCIFSIHACIEGHLRCAYVSPIVHDAAVSVGLPVSFHSNVVISSWKISTSGIAISYSSYVFNFWGNIYTVFHRGCINLDFHQQYAGFPFLHILTSTCYLLSFW